MRDYGLLCAQSGLARQACLCRFPQWSRKGSWRPQSLNPVPHQSAVHASRKAASYVCRQPRIWAAGNPEYAFRAEDGGGGSDGPSSSSIQG